MGIVEGHTSSTHELHSRYTRSHPHTKREPSKQACSVRAACRAAHCMLACLALVSYVDGSSCNANAARVLSLCAPPRCPRIHMPGGLVVRIQCGVICMCMHGTVMAQVG